MRATTHKPTTRKANRKATPARPLRAALLFTFHFSLFTLLRPLRAALLFTFHFSLFTLFFSSCETDHALDPTPPPGADADHILFNISINPPTRVATDAGMKSTWEVGDQIGVFAVEHNSEPSGNPAENVIHNVRLTFDGTSWVHDTGVAYYWNDIATALDFYAYYPYANATNPRNIEFTVQTDQNAVNASGQPGYNRSDLLRAISNNLDNGWRKTDGPVSLTFQHMMAMVQLTVDDQLGALHPSATTVKLRGVYPAAILSLVNDGSIGTSLLPGIDPVDITMHRAVDGPRYVYRALVPRQTLAHGVSLFRIADNDVILDSKKLTANINITNSSAYTFTEQVPITALPLIPKGKFMMGSPANEPNRYNRETQHSVILTDDFYMGRYEVTFAQYDAYCIEKGITPPTDEFDWGRGNRPVIMVSWHDAMAYCEWLLKKIDPAGITNLTCTLPTEAQWEYACRGNYPNKATETATMPFGLGDGSILYADMANFDGRWPYDLAFGGVVNLYDGSYNGHPNTWHQMTMPVGSYAPNNYGLYDMHGNVREWCLDQCSYPPADYAPGEATDPEGNSGTYRIVRGGSFYDISNPCRSASRFGFDPATPNNTLGFRVAFIPI